MVGVIEVRQPQGSLDTCSPASYHVYSIGDFQHPPLMPGPLRPSIMYPGILRQAIHVIRMSNLLVQCSSSYTLPLPPYYPPPPSPGLSVLALDGLQGILGTESLRCLNLE